MNNNKKLFAFDVDGTLLNDQKNVLDSTKKAIQLLIQKGNVVCLSTGRTPVQTIDLISMLNLKHFVIGSGGATIYDLESRTSEILCDKIPDKDLQLMWEYAKKYQRELGFNNGIKFWRSYFGKDPHQEINDWKFFYGGTSANPIYDPIEESAKAFYKENIIQAAIKLESSKIPELIRDLKPLLSDEVDLHITSGVYFEIGPKNINKYNAIKLMQQKYNILNEDTYCFGDSDNDYEMIKYSGNGVAMGNAIDEIKNIAKYVIENNNTDAIYNFLLSKKLI